MSVPGRQRLRPTPQPRRGQHPLPPVPPPPGPPIIPPPEPSGLPLPPENGPSRRTALKWGLGVVVVAVGGEIVWQNRPQNHTPGTGTRVNPHEFIGSGGIDDDSERLIATIRAFEQAPDGTRLTLRGVIRFAMKGGDRVGGLKSGAGITMRGGRNKTIFFDPTAVLLMDNLNKKGQGSSHGIAWLGAGEGNALINPHVRWAKTPGKRSLGDGIRIVGYPSDGKPTSDWTYTTGTMSNFRLVNWTVENAPQTGAILMGCSDPVVSGGKAINTQADGLHFNACRRPVVHGHTSSDTGDDGLAFVTYYDAASVIKGKEGPFNQPSLGEWSNSRAQADNIVVSGGRADGVRVSGTLGATLRTLNIRDKERCGVIIDSAKQNNVYHWTYEASQDVVVAGADIAGCGNGIVVTAQNVTAADPSTFWDFGVQVSGANVQSSNSNASFVVTAPSDVLNLITNVQFPLGTAVSRRVLH